MPAVILHSTAHDALTHEQTLILRNVGIGVLLGVPALFAAPDGQIWLIYDDPRMTLADAAYGAVIFANLDSLDYDPTGKTPEQIGSDIREWAQQFNPHVPEIPEDVNPWQYTLEANNAPAIVRMSSGIPEGWVPYSPEEA